MFCPNDECPDFLTTGLRSEYRQDVTICPICATHLVAVASAAEPPARTTIRRNPGSATMRQWNR